MPSLMTCSLNYQQTVTPELRRHLRLFNNINDNYINNKNKQEVKFEIIGEKEEKESKEDYLNKQELKQLLTNQHQQLQQQQQKSHKDCLQKILKKSQQQYKRRRWVLSCNLITILKQIKLTNPTFDIQQKQQQHHLLQQLQLQQQLKQQQQHLLKI